MARVLLLGGTGEARALASALADRPDLHVISSLAGRVAAPVLPVGEVRIGGFGGPGGLRDWVREHRVDVIVDATHPFAATMTASAAGAGVPLFVLRRPGWTAGPGDDWRRVPDLAAAAGALPAGRVFLSTGRKDLGPFVGLDGHCFLLRSIDPPDPPLPRRLEVVLARGPFTLDGELALLRDHRIDVVVTKDSGGAMTAAKLTAARELGLPVVVVDRPALPAEVPVVATVAEAVAWLDRF